jgi:hypothetical protein
MLRILEGNCLQSKRHVPSFMLLIKSNNVNRYMAHPT